MTCRELLEHVPDLVEGTLDARLGARVDAHLAECDACRALVADLRRIRQTAATLDRHALPPGARERLVARLETEGVLRAPARGTHRGAWVWLAAAAVLLVAVSAGIWSVARRVDSGDTVPSRTASGNAPSGDLVENIESELQLAASHYENAIKGLEQVADASDSPLDPVMMATIKENLAVIDAAIDESRVALRSDPGSQVAQENLFEAFRRKIGLLQDTIALMNEMRKGDQAGAARIVEGLNKS
jgi:anti-sigma factor RsiW